MSIKRWMIALLATSTCACGKESPAGDGVFSARTTAASTATSADVVGTSADVEVPVVGAELRAKLKLLAVASECMRRGDEPADEIAEKMLALYRTHGVELAVYAREMGRLGGDAAFQTEIQAELEHCPTPAVAVGTPEPDVTDDPESESTDVALPDDPNDVGTPDLAVEDAEAQGDVGPTEIADVLDEPDKEPEDVATSSATAERDDLSGTWTGAVRGSVSATLRVIVRGRRVSSATMTWSGRNVRLQGTIAKNGQMSLGGRINEADFIRIRGRIKGTGRTLAGTWDGVIERKRASGSVQLSR